MWRLIEPDGTVVGQPVVMSRLIRSERGRKTVTETDRWVSGLNDNDVSGDGDDGRGRIHGALVTIRNCCQSAGNGFHSFDRGCNTVSPDTK